MISKKLLSALFAVFSISVIFSQWYPVNETVLDLSFINKKFKTERVYAFAISNLITVREFNEYLKAIEKDSSETFYKSQLPKSGTISEKMVNAIVSDTSLRNKPMPGVSWTVARNYCKWLNRQSTNAQSSEFDLPYLTELIAFNILYKREMNDELKSWTLNSYDESMYAFNTSAVYCYDAKKDDPPAMKRKTIFGSSYHMPNIGLNRQNILNYEYQDSSSREVGFRIVKRFKLLKQQSLCIEDLSITFGLNNNHLEGIYQEYYDNGRLKVLGMFANHNRMGIWSVWDEKGDLKIQRNYSNNLTCDFIYPRVDFPYQKIYEAFPEYQLRRNSSHIYPYRYVEERAVVYSKRIWRELNVKNEPYLFDQVDFKVLIDSLFKSTTKWFHYGTSGNFSKAVPGDSIPILKQQALSWDMSRIEIKEDFFINKDNLLSDSRPLALSFYEDSSSALPSYSLYYPYVRHTLGGFILNNAPMNEILNLDDLFFFHCYRGKIIATTSLNFERESMNSEPSKDLMEEIQKFTVEHNGWLMFGK
jgi:antitoxin component YwqK of YwqJK toxin-antitoxin module